MKIEFQSLWAVFVALILVGCSSHPRRVDCEGHLRPINAPAPVGSSSVAHP